MISLAYTRVYLIIAHAYRYTYSAINKRFIHRFCLQIDTIRVQKYEILYRFYPPNYLTPI